MPKCENCGKEFEGNFCPSCGTKAGTAEEKKFLNETRIDLNYNLRMTDNMAGKKSQILLIVAALCLLVCGGVFLALELTLFKNSEPDFIFQIFLLTFGAVLLVFAFAFRPLVKMLLKKNMQGKESVNSYTFTETGYEVVTKLNDGTESKASGGYAAFTEAREYRDMWLLYLNKATVFSVDKAGMTEGTVEELSALFMRNMGARYKVRYSK